jgi:two-component system nitrogen regulation response regulator GlnG
MNNTNEVWIVDDDDTIRWILEKALLAAAIATRSFASSEKILSALKSMQPVAIITDIRMPGGSGLELLATIQTQYAAIPVIVMTAHSDLESAVSSYQGGAFEYLPKPFDIDEAVNIVKRAIAHRQTITSPNAELLPVAQDIIGEAPAMQEVFRAIGRLAHSPITVLINGASGTGKELVARALHRHSPRGSKPFIALNMAAIPHDLIESELFGHERGAFTGATQQRRGRFEQADGGTLFLDEIGDMPSDAQTRLLRVLSDGIFYRVGGHTAIHADVRIITATHQDLEKRVAEGKFREDLFHRLNVIRIHLPNLSDRNSDIPLLTKHFLQQAAQELKVEPKTLSKSAEHYLCDLPWPGNVRQLENTCRWLTVMASGRQIHINDLPPELQKQTSHKETATDWEGALKQWAQQAIARGDNNILTKALNTLEKNLIEVALAHTKDHRQEAAHLLGCGRNTLTRKIKELFNQ